MPGYLAALVQVREVQVVLRGGGGGRGGEAERDGERGRGNEGLRQTGDD